MVTAIAKLSEEELEQAKEQVEELLREYPLLRSKANVERAKSKKEFAVGAVAYDQPSGGKTNAIYSSTESHVTDKIESAEEAVRIEQVIDVVDNALNCLSLEEGKVVNLKYFKRCKIAKIAVEMDISRRTVYNRRDSALEKLVKLDLHKICT